MAARDLKPRTVGELLDASFFVYRRQFTRLALVAVIVSVPAVVIAVLYSGAAAAAVREATATIDRAARTQSADPWTPIGLMFGALGKLLPQAFVAILLQAVSRAGVAAAMAPVALAAVRREPLPGLAEIARTAGPRLLPVFLLQIAFDLGWSTLSCCCPPVGLLVGVALAPASAILVLERGPLETSLRANLPAAVAFPFVPFAACIDAVSRGMRLSWNAAVFGRAVACFGMLTTLVWVFTAAVANLTKLLAPESGDWFWAQHCAEMLFLPALGLGRALWWCDLVARREGADLEPAA